MSTSASPYGKTWSMLPPMSTPRVFCSMTAISMNTATSMDKEKEVLIVAGGWNDDKYKGLNSAEMFDPETRQWEQLPPMTSGRHSCACAAIGSQFFVIGGNNGNACSCIVEMFDLKTKQWTTLPSMTTKRSECAAVAVGQTLIVIGGFTDSGTTSIVEQYNVEDKKWSSLPSMPTDRDACAAAVIGNKIYVVGGRNGCDWFKTVECYDVESGEWKTLPPMIHARDACAAASMGKHLFVMGGDDWDKGLDSAEVFDVETEKWTMLPNMSDGRWGCAAAVMGNRVCVVGGYGEDYAKLSTCEELCVDKSKTTLVEKPKTLMVMEQQGLTLAEKAKSPNKKKSLTLAQRVERLEDAFGLGSTSGKMLRGKVCVLECEFFGEAQKGNLMQCIERLESCMFENEFLEEVFD